LVDINKQIYSYCQHASCRAVTFMFCAD